MSRTTLDIDAPILRDLLRIRKREGRSLGRIVSDLLAEALARRPASPEAQPPFRWVAKPMGNGVDLEDKDALWRELERGRH